MKIGGKKQKTKKKNNSSYSIPLNLLNLSSLQISLNCYSIRLKVFGGHHDHDFTPRIPVRVSCSGFSPVQGRFTIKGENSVLMPILRSSDQLGVHGSLCILELFLKKHRSTLRNIRNLWMYRGPLLRFLLVFSTENPGPRRFSC